MNRVIEEYKKQRKAEKENRQRMSRLSFRALAEEHAAKVRRFRALKKNGVSQDATIMKELRRDIKAATEEIRERVNKSEMRSVKRSDSRQAGRL